MTLSTIDMAKRFVALHAERRELEAKLDAIKYEMDQIEPHLLEQCEQLGVASLNIDGHTTYIHTQVWARAKDGDKPRACEALKNCGFGAFVREDFNTNQVSALIREMVAGGGDVPSEIKSALDITEDHSIRVRKS